MTSLIEAIPEYLFIRLSDKHMGNYKELYASAYKITIDNNFCQRKSYGWVEKNDFLAFGIVHKGNLIAAITWLPRAFYIGDIKLITVEATDVMVDPNFQGKSFFSKLIRYSFCELDKLGIPLIYGFPNNKALVGWMRAGANLSYETNIGIANLRPARRISQAFKRRRILFPDFIVPFCDRLYKILMYSLYNLNDYSFSISKNMNISAGVYNNLNRRKCLLQRDKSQDFFHWRYSWGGIDNNNYRTVIIKKDCNDISYINLKLGTSDDITIYDIGCNDSRELSNVISVLLLKALPQIELTEHIIISRVIFYDLCGNKAMLNSMKKNGFFFRPTRHFLIMYALDEDYKWLLNIDNWELNLADTDEP